MHSRKSYTVEVIVPLIAAQMCLHKSHTVHEYVVCYTFFLMLCTVFMDIHRDMFMDFNSSVIKNPSYILISPQDVLNGRVIHRIPKNTKESALGKCLYCMCYYIKITFCYKNRLILSKLLKLYKQQTAKQW